jgi:hypothetical protein
MKRFDGLAESYQNTWCCLPAARHGDEVQPMGHCIMAPLLDTSRRQQQCHLGHCGTLIWS